MNPAFDTSVIGFSWQNAAACVQASQWAYDEEPTVSCPVTDTRVVIRDCGSAIVVAFRGTKSLINFLTDVKIRRRTLSDSQPGNPVRIHRGFDAALESVFPAVKDEVLRLQCMRLAGPKPIFITGHSLGGALAMLCAFRMLPPINIHSVYTFGQPRTGNKAFAALYDQMLRIKTFRFVDQQDGVPRVPGPWWPQYHHAGQLVFMNSLGTIWMNPPLLEMIGSDVWGFYKDWKNIPLADLLRDHALDLYASKVNALAARGGVLTSDGLWPHVKS